LRAQQGNPDDAVEVLMNTAYRFSHWQKLSSKIVGALLAFLVPALVAICVTLYLSWQLEGSAAAINDAGSLRMQCYRLTVLLSGLQQQPVPGAVQEQMAAIDVTLGQIGRGDPSRPLFLPPDPAIHRQFAQLQQYWSATVRPSAAALSTLPLPMREAAWRPFQQQIDNYVASLNTFVHLMERDSEQRTFWLRSWQLVLVVLAVIGTLGLICLMFRLIIAPVNRLREGIVRMKNEDFDVRLTIDRGDEFGQLALGFNEMADRLQALYSNLEERVRDKTRALEDQNGELALLYDSAAFLQQPQPLEALCEGFMQRLLAYFRADGGAVRILDPGRGNLHIVAHQGLSDELVESVRCMKVSECACGEVLERPLPVLHDLRSLDPRIALKCRHDGFASVSVFHILARQQNLGSCNLHFRQERVFSAREEALMEALGRLLGVAIENLRLGGREREMAVSEERNLVAQGLHDSIAQSLNYLNLQVQMLDQSVQDNRFDEIADIVPALRAGVQESYEDVRELLLNYRSRLMEDDLIGSLQTTIERFRRQTGIAAELVADVDGAPFPREQQLQLLFIVQEALSNIRKHALASRVEIRLEDSHDFCLTIKDNGVGFDAGMLADKSENHVGIHIMRERAQRIEASFGVESVPGGGTTVRLQLHHDQRRAA